MNVELVKQQLKDFPGSYSYNSLKAEGLMREIIHIVNNLRKAAGFEVTDHIVIYIEQKVNPLIKEAMQIFEDNIKSELLANKIYFDLEIPAVASISINIINGILVTAGIKRSTIKEIL